MRLDISLATYVIDGKSELCSSSFTQDAFKNWNNAPNVIKECNSIDSAKKEIKKLVLTFPL